MPEKKATKLNKDNAAQLAVRVSCSKLTYKETKTKKTIGTGEDLWGDMTWVVKTSENYDMGAAPKVTGFRYTEPTGSFMSGKTDVNDMLGTSDFKPVTQLYGATGAELRLPLRFGYENLVDALKDDKKVLHAGWLAAFETVGEDKVVKKEWVNIGCSIKQTKLASILDSALNGKPIGGQTVHILFSDQAPKGQLVGENGWCYGLTTGGATPLFKPHSSTETGKLCNF